MKRPVVKISNHSRRLATFASDVIDHSRRLAKVANLRFALLRVQSKRTCSEVVVVKNPGLQIDDCEADAISTAYLNINMAEVARTCVGYPS